MDRCVVSTVGAPYALTWHSRHPSNSPTHPGTSAATYGREHNLAFIFVQTKSVTSSEDFSFLKAVIMHIEGYRCLPSVQGHLILVGDMITLAVRGKVFEIVIRGRNLEII